MRDRVLIQPDGTCQVSLPGHDVKTASLDQMSFDARFAAIGQAVWGFAPLNNRDAGVSAEGTKKTVLLGRTFNLPPMFLFGWKLSATDPQLRPPRISGYSQINFKLNAQVDAKVRTDSVTFTNWYTDPKKVTVYWKALV